MSPRNPSDAQRYSSQKYTLNLLEMGLQLIALYVFMATGASAALARRMAGIIPAGFLTYAVFLLSISLAYYFLSFPLTLYRSFLLEHRFGLSKMSVASWFMDQLKSGVIAYTLTLIMLSAFYFLLNRYPAVWWVHVSVFWIFLTFLLAKLAPLIIVPLFFKYTPVGQGPLRERIVRLGEKMQIKFLDVFQIDMSKKTNKANAAFLGWGATKRVILGDTLRERYSDDEIGVIVAHEFAHYKHKHLFKLLGTQVLLTGVLFYVIFISSPGFLVRFGYDSLADVAALPLIFLYFHVFGIILQPAQAFFSRRMERTADMTALAVTGDSAAFVSTMDKLGTQNLADRNPHPLIKFFFFDHPPIGERIAMAKESCAK